MTRVGSSARNGPRGLAILEITGFGPALVAVDHAEKAADVRLVQAELNDYYGYVVKFTGDSASLRAAVAAGCAVVERMGGKCISSVIDAVDPEAWPGVMSQAEFNPLIQ